MRPAVFLDRDGTINEDVGYLDRVERLTLFPYSIDAVRLLNSAGFCVVVVTNQRGVATGLISETFLHTVHDVLSERFRRVAHASSGSTTVRMIRMHRSSSTDVTVRVGSQSRALSCRRPTIWGST